MKKIFIILALCMFTLVGCDKIKKKIKDVVEDPPIKESIPLMNFDKYKDFVIDNVESMSVIKYTEGGADEKKVTDKEAIKSRYNSLKKIKIGNETNRACDDNTTIYRFNMKDGTSTSFEFECDWLVIGNKRYEIKK